MKILWQRILNRSNWFWGVVGALCVAAVLLVLSSLPKSEPIADFNDESAMTIPEATTFHVISAESVLSVPAVPSGPTVTVDHIILEDNGAPASYIAYRSNLPSTLDETYLVSALPTTEDAQHVFRIMYQSVPYLTENEIISLLTQKGFADANKLTLNDIIAATQLAIVSVVNNMDFDFTAADAPLVKSLYAYYKALSADMIAAPITFRIDTTRAMWASGTLYGPMRILSSVDGYANGAAFDLQVTGDNADGIIFKSAANQPITSIGVNVPFYLQIMAPLSLSEAEHIIDFKAVSKDDLSHNGNMLALTRQPVTLTSADMAASSQHSPILPDTLFSAYSIRAKPIVTATIHTSSDILK